MSNSRAHKLPGKCLFCEGGVSDEHLFPIWMQEHFPKPKEKTFHLRSALSLTTAQPGQRANKEIRRKKQGDITTIIARKACRDCNGGWMSRIENSAKAVLGPLIEGKEFYLSDDSKRLVATWAALKSCIINSLDRDQNLNAVSAEDCAWIKMHQEPPKHWKVWLSRLKPDDRPKSAHRVVEYNLPDALSGPKSKMQTTTIGLGQVGLHVLSVSHEEFARQYGMFIEMLAPILPLIWPLDGQSVNWPLGRSGTEADFSQLRDALIIFSDMQKQMAINAGIIRHP